MTSTNASITYDEFERFSLAYLSARDASPFPTISEGELSWLTYSQRWTWLPPHPSGSAAFYPIACLSRTFPILAPRSAVADEAESLMEDDSIEAVEQAEQESLPAEVVVTVTQSIHWSSIWRLPVLYFHASSPSGQPLSLDQLISAGVMHASNTLPLEENEGGAGIGGVSVADHPRSGLPSFYLHPCNTKQALTALWAQESGKAQERGEAYMAAFISLCSSAVEMRAP